MNNNHPIKSFILTQNPWERFNELIVHGNYSYIFLICDKNTERECLPYFLEKTKLAIHNKAVIPSGEHFKELDTCQQVWNEWIMQGIDRSSVVICLGGGVVCDLGGFSAACVLRGVDFYYVPTSLMAMADAAIGGKTGVNFMGIKNQLGNYQQAKAVVIDSTFLNTLDQQHLKNGFVEIIKHGLIENPPYWEEFENLTWPLAIESIEHLIRRSIRTKSGIVEQDFSEKGIRKILNFGHSIGHSIEAVLLDLKINILHGEAVAIGIICEAFISSHLYNWRADYLRRVKTMLIPYTGMFKIDEEMEKGIFELLHYDKKRRGKKVLFSLLESPGKPALDIEVAEDLIAKSLDYYRD